MAGVDISFGYLLKELLPVSAPAVVVEPATAIGLPEVSPPFSLVRHVPRLASNGLRVHPEDDAHGLDEDADNFITEDFHFLISEPLLVIEPTLIIEDDI